MWWEREKSDLLMDIFCVSFFLLSHCIDWAMWVMCLISVLHSMMILLCLRCCSLFTWKEREKCDLLMDVFHVLLLFSLHRLSFMSVVFDFNDSLNDVVPVSPILLSEVKQKEKVNGWWLYYVCLLSSPPRLSSVNVVFNFNASLNDAAPATKKPLTFDVKKGKRVICWWMCFVCLFPFVFTTQVEFSECCVWFQCFTQWRSSYGFNDVACLIRQKGKEWVVDEGLWCVLSFVFTTQI